MRAEYRRDKGKQRFCRIGAQLAQKSGQNPCAFCMAALSLHLLCACSIILSLEQQAGTHRQSRLRIVNMSAAENVLRNRRVSLFSGLTRRVSQYRTYRQTLTELECLSERELTDLGINRGQLRAIAYRAAYDG